MKMDTHHHTSKTSKSFLTNLTAITLVLMAAIGIGMESKSMSTSTSTSTSTSLFFVDARRSGGGSGSGRSSAGRVPSRTGGGASRRGGGGGSGGSRKSTSRSSSQQVASKRRKSSYYEDDHDDEDEDDVQHQQEDDDHDNDEPEMNFGFLDDGDDTEEEHGDDGYDDEYEPEEPRSSSRGRGGRSSSSSSSSRGGQAQKRGGSSSSRRSSASSSNTRRSKYEQDYEDDSYDFDDYPPQPRRTTTNNNKRSSSPNNRRGGRTPPNSSNKVVPYGSNSRGRGRQPTPSAFTRGLAALRESIPDPNAFKDTAMNSLSAAKETTTKLTSNIYREVKGLTSSELEQVMLKATAPNDVPVKGKHVERLVGVTYQISGRYDIYDAVLRKLWGKMVENDWRTTVKALYILHRFSADGAPDHQAALKARLRELRRTRDPKRGKEKYFNSKQLLSGDTSPANIPFRAFLSRYAHYVLLRAQCFGGVFTEIANDPNKQSKPTPSSNKQSNSRSSRQQQQKQQQQQQKQQQNSRMAKKSITSTCLKNEHLEAAQMLLKAGLACELKSNGEEECENTAIALERVVSDLIGLTTAVANALNNALRGEYDDDTNADWELVAKWCDFYSTQLLVQTKAMMKRTTPILDAYGLFLPSRMGASVSQDLLQKGLKGKSSRSMEGEVEDEGESSRGAGVGADEDKVCRDNEEEEEDDQEKRSELDDEDDENDIDEERGEEEIIDEDDGYDEYDEYEYEEYDEYE